MDRSIKKLQPASPLEGQATKHTSKANDRDAAAFRKSLEKKAARKAGKDKTSPAYLKKRKKRRILAAVIPAAILAVVFALYLTFVYSSIPLIANWRAIWIETAMSTRDHQWLATAFIPDSIIQEVLKNQVAYNEDIQGGGEHLKEKDPNDTPSVVTPVEPGNDDILDQKNLKVGELDYAGNTVLINDIEQGLVVSEIEGTNSLGTFRGKIMLIDDPSRVYVGTTPYKNDYGLRMPAMMEYYDAIAGVNGSGFYDPNENGDGGDVVGLCYSQGEAWGYYTSYYGSVVLTTDNKLVVGNISDWEKYNIRDGIQFGPALIADGVPQVSGTAGYGVHPRTAIGQREDGVMVFLIIDGRLPGHSVGCTVGDLVDILMEYDVVNAGCCDGGASSVLAYEGKIITKNSSLHPDLGRMLPNAFLVAKKDTDS